MTNGIYYIIFKSYLGIIGDGLVVVDNGKVQGGDSRYLYRGTYKVDGTSIRAEIQVSYYRGTLKSVFGSLSKLARLRGFGPLNSFFHIERQGISRAGVPAGGENRL